MEANVRALPPLDRALSIEIDGNRAVLRDGDTVVIEVAGREFELQIPARPTLATAEATSRDPITHEHPYPTASPAVPSGPRATACACSWEEHPDPSRSLAAAWTPDPRLAPRSDLPTEFVWAALDCPTISASWLEAGGRVATAPGTFSVLARQRVEQLAPTPLGQPAIVSAWAIAHDGRKHLAGAATGVAGRDRGLAGTPPTHAGSRFRCSALLVGVTGPTCRSESRRVQLDSPTMRRRLFHSAIQAGHHLECRGLVALLEKVVMNRWLGLM
jgi:hypothetical protein